MSMGSSVCCILTQNGGCTLKFSPLNFLHICSAKILEETSKIAMQIECKPQVDSHRKLFAEYARIHWAEDPTVRKEHIPLPNTILEDYRNWLKVRQWFCIDASHSKSIRISFLVTP